MSTIVKDIFDAIDSTVSTELPTYQKMRRIYNPENNDPRSAERSYAVRHIGADFADGVTRVYTLDHGFEVLLMRRTIDKSADDSDIQTTINDLYDQADELLKKFFLSKLGLGSTILIIDGPSLSEPEIFENQTVLLRIGFNVKYRQTVV